MSTINLTILLSCISLSINIIVLIDMIRKERKIRAKYKILCDSLRDETYNSDKR